ARRIPAGSPCTRWPPMLGRVGAGWRTRRAQYNRWLPWDRPDGNSMRPLFKNLIAGEWHGGASVTVNRNPSDTSDVIGEYAQADREQAEAAIAAARQAFPAWAT